MIPVSVYLYILITLLFVSYGDIKTQKIPNLWSILNIMVFPVLLFFFPDQYNLSFETFFFSIVFLIVGFVLFLLKIMGGGDSKFLFTLFLVVPLSAHFVTLYALIIATVMIGSFFFITNLVKNFDKIIEYAKEGNKRGIKECFGTKFSFAPVILISWIFVGWYLRDHIYF